jgi:protein-tyrosine kinase
MERPSGDTVIADWQPEAAQAAVSDVHAANSPPTQLIGAILAQTRDLDAAAIERVLAQQKAHGQRFGEAAIALGLASTDDVLFALAQQFNYPYAPEERRKLSPELVALNEPFSRQAEAFRAVRSQLMMRVFGASGKPRQALAVISPESGDGKTFFAANLAVVLAQLGGRTLLVDADMRGPRQHEVFHLGNVTGLSGILSGRSERHVVQRVPGVPSLFVMPVGVTPPNPLELVERPIFAQLLRELTTRFEHVIVDTPAHVYGADGPVIASRCGHALIVARKHSSRIDALQQLVSVFSAGSTQMAGVIVNEFTG